MPRRLVPRRLGPRRLGAPKGGGPNLEKVGPGRVGASEGWGPQRVGAPKGGGPEGWGPRRVGGPKFRAFVFSPLPPLFSFFLPLVGVVSLNFGGVIEGLDPQMCTFGVLGLSCEPPAAKFWEGPAEGGPAGESGEGSSGGESGERPNFGRTMGDPAQVLGKGVHRRVVHGPKNKT